MLELTVKRPHHSDSIFLHKEGKEKMFILYRLSLQLDEAREIGGETLPEVLRYFENGSLSIGGIEGMIKASEHQGWLYPNGSLFEPEYFWQWVLPERPKSVRSFSTTLGRLESAVGDRVSFYQLAGIAPRDLSWVFRSKLD